MRPVWLVLGLSVLGAAGPICASGSDWAAPTPDELKMTADPAAPGAAAVYLYREELTDDKLHVQSLSVRIKVLTEKGKSWGDVQIPFYGSTYSIDEVAARTIHADGTVIPLIGKPIEKMLSRQGDQQTTAFSLPSVEVGSILEYRYKLRYDDHRLIAPRWVIEQPIYLHRAHYRFVPSESRFIHNGRGDRVVELLWTGILPPGDSVKTVRQANGSDAYELDVSEVPALPHESYMPPIGRSSYRELFYYSSTRNPDEFWKQEGKRWSKDVDEFASPSPGMHAAVGSLTASGDTPEEKLRKIYAAVMAMENTNFTREHTEAERKAEGVKVKTADDIWAQKWGNGREIDRLFLALTRAAGLKAYAMIVVNRDRDQFMANYLDWSQLNDEIVVVQLNGAEIFVDPGERYAEFGKLHWKHTLADGVRQVEGGTALAESGTIGYKDSSVVRTANLKVDEHGAVTGIVRVVMTGVPALNWRQRALLVDDDALHQEYDQAIRNEYPAGVEVKLDHFVGLADPDHALMAVLKVEGTLGSSAGHRLLFPVDFFASDNRRLFTEQTRETPIDLRYPIARKDMVTWTLPSALKVESLPKDDDLSLPKCAMYSARYGQKENTLTATRTFVLGVSLYAPQEYGGLRDFYQKMDAKDDEQAVLTVAGSAGGEQ